MDPQDMEIGAAPDLAGGVSGTASPAGDENTPNPPDLDAGDGGEAPEQDAGGAPDQGQARGRPANENRIPYSRVREMVRRAEAEAEERMRRQMQPVLERMRNFDPESIQQGIAQRFLETLYPGAQITKKEAPKYVTAEEMQSLLQQRDQQYRAEMTRTAEIQKAERAIEAGKRKYADVFQAFPKLESYIINAWGAQGDKTIEQIVEDAVADVKGLIDRGGSQYVEGKERAAQVRPLAPGGQNRSPAPKGPDLSTEDGAEKAALAFLKRASGR